MIVKKGDWITPLRDFDGCDISAGQPILFPTLRRPWSS